MSSEANLYFMCGKMAAGKSTYAKQLARDQNAVLLVQDDFVAALFPGEIQDIPSFVKYSGRLRNALSNHICDLLSRGTSVVLDFPGNTRNQRQWFRELFERANVEHELLYIDAADDLCKRQLKQRSEAPRCRENEPCRDPSGRVSPSEPRATEICAAASMP